MATIKSKSTPSARKATIVEDATPKGEGLFEGMEALFKAHEIVMPSTTRWVVALTVSAVAGGVIGYAGGTLLGYCVAGVLLFSGSALLAFLVYFLGILIIMITAFKTGGFIGGFIMSGDVDRCYQNVSNRVSGWFGSARNMVTS